MDSKQETRRFTKKEEYIANLQSVLDQLSERGEFVIYLHEMSPDYSVPTDKDPRRIAATEKRANTILIEGLDTGDYGSINGTARCYGEASKVKAEDIYAYTYPFCNPGDMRAVAIIAIPKYIEVDGKRLQYGSYDAMNNVSEMEKAAGISPRGDHRCICVYDCIKEWPYFDENEKPKQACSSAVPLQYLLGVQEIVEKDDDYRLVLSHTHIAEIPQSEKEKHLREAVYLIKQWAAKCGSMDEGKMIFAKTRYDYPKWEEREWQSDSDW